MGVFFVYIFKSAVCLILFYLFFRLFLSKETFHRFNRIALLGILCFSWMIPCIEITTKQQIEVNQAVLTIEQLLLMAENTSSTITADAPMPETPSVSWIQIVLLIYLAGILFFACRNIYSLGCLIKLLLFGKKERFEKGITLVVHDKEIAPFSWMKFIVISRKDLEKNGREILIHEKAHIRNRHSIDLLVADICIFFQWFNPGAWLLKQELHNIHEYEADEMVINEGVDAKEYQLLLIKKAVGTRLYSMASSFNHSKLKKRITMMLKEKSNPWARLKYLYVLPLAVVAVTAFARPEVSNTLEEASAVNVNRLAVVLQKEMPKDTVKSKIVILGGRIEKPQKSEVNEEKLEVFEVVEQVPTFVGGENSLRRYLSTKLANLSLNNKSGTVNVGFTISESGMVKDVHVLGSSAVALNGEALRIVSEMPAWIPGKQHGQPVAVKCFIPVSFSSEPKVRGVNFNTAGKKPLVIKDGKEITLEQLNGINTNTIESISILKDSEAIKIYGEPGAEGVILVTTKSESKREDRLENGRTDLDVKGNPDFFVTGTVVDNRGKVMPKVTVIIPHTSYGAITDDDGRFEIKAFEGGTLVFSHIGFKSAKIPVSSSMKVKMEQNILKILD